MKQHIPSFPLTPWDGLATQYDDRQHDKWADHFMYDAIAEELKATQQWLLSHYVFDFFDPLGPGNSIVGVSNDSALLEWKSIVAGNNVTINHDGANIVVSASGGVEATGPANTLLGMNNDANATEWKTLIAGDNITINNDGANITIASNASGLPNFDGANKFLTTNADNNAAVWRTIANGANVTLSINDTTLTIDATAGPGGSGDQTTLEITNNQAATINIGQPVYATANGVKLARANASGTVEVVGLVKDTTIADAANGNIVTAGAVTANTTQWDAVTGGSGGLTPGSVYFLSAATAGLLTTTAPTANGSFVARVGRAASTTKLILTLDQPIWL